MIRTVVFVAALFVSVSSDATSTLKPLIGATNCEVKPDTNLPNDWTLKKTDFNCVSSMNGQVKKEIEASLTYLAMASHFSRDTVNRPGFAKFFFDAASEERHHAKLLIEYLTMRGSFDASNLREAGTNIAINMKKNYFPADWDSLTPSVAIGAALKLEKEVTDSIISVIGVCEKDYHLADYLSGDFLTEQYEGMKDLAGKLSTLNKLLRETSDIGVFIIDKKLLNGEVL